MKKYLFYREDFRGLRTPVTEEWLVTTWKSFNKGSKKQKRTILNSITKQQPYTLGPFIIYAEEQSNDER